MKMNFQTIFNKSFLQYSVVTASIGGTGYIDVYQLNVQSMVK